MGEFTLNKSYDIIVIGAGPAGTMAAYNLAKYFKVLIVEAFPLPRNKSCSGVLIKKSVDILETYFGPIPGDVKTTPWTTNGITIVDASMKGQDYIDEGMNVRRDYFDHWLAQHAIQAGADLIDNARVIKIQDSLTDVSVTIKGKKTHHITAKIVVACDGVNGTSRMLTQTPQQDKVVTYQKFYQGRASIDQSKFYAYISKDFSEYDAWINSKDDLIVIGTIAKTLKKAADFHEQFMNFLKKDISLNIEKEIKSEAWCLPLVIPDMPVVLRNKRVFFAGEAAGLLNPFGEGISIALMSGLSIADACSHQKASELMDCKAIEETYRMNMADELVRMKRQWDFLKIFYPYFWGNTLKCTR